MTYPLYGKEWHLTPTETTAIFAVYPTVVGGVLIGLGDVSDYIGRRATMLMGLGASLLGVLLFAVAPDIRWVFIGRALMVLGLVFQPPLPLLPWFHRTSKHYDQLVLNPQN